MIVCKLGSPPNQLTNQYLNSLLILIFPKFILLLLFLIRGCCCCFCYYYSAFTAFPTFHWGLLKLTHFLPSSLSLTHTHMMTMYIKFHAKDCTRYASAHDGKRRIKSFKNEEQKKKVGDRNPRHSSKQLKKNKTKAQDNKTK